MIGKLKNLLHKNSHIQEIMIGSAVTFILKISGMLLGYIVILVISRSYDAEGVGLYNLTFSILTFATMIGSFGINTSILRYIGQFNKETEKYKIKLLYLYSVELVIPFSIFLGLVLYFFSEYISINILNNVHYDMAIKIISVLIPFLVIQNISVEFLRGINQIKISELLRSVSRPFINISSLLIANMFFINLLLPIYTLGLGIVLSSITAIYFVFKKIANISYNKGNIFPRKELLKTSIPMMFNSIIWFLFGNLSLYMIAIYNTTEQVGIYSVALKISMIMNIILVVVNTIVAPKISTLYWSKNFEELKFVLRTSANLIFFVSFIITIPMLFLSSEILQFFGEDFISGEKILIVLVIGQLISAFFGSTGIFMSMTGHQSVELKVGIFILVLSFIAYKILLPLYGLFAAASIYVISSLIWNLIMVIYIRLKLNIISYCKIF